MSLGTKKKYSDPLKLSVLMPVYNERFLIEAAIRRVLSFKHPMVKELELIVVDDGSTDGTREILGRLDKELSELRLFLQERNQGKGAAIRQAIREATGDLSVIQDADLEYNPEDWALMLAPFLELDADAVFGSRFLAPTYHRVLYFWHTLGNRFLTLMSNVMTDLNLTDMETCYKMVRTELLKSIPIRSHDFSIEPELTAKLAKRGAVIYEVPVGYAGRTYKEGKKISARHGVTALTAILKWKLIDDIFQDDEYGSAILASLNNVHQFNRWTAEVIAPYVGRKVLEVGAGIGNLTIQLLPRMQYVATDINHHYLAFLHNLAVGKPYLKAHRLDLLTAQDFAALHEQFDTVLCLNVLEHVEDPLQGLRNILSVLEEGGKAIVIVPQGQWLYSSLDEAVGHTHRYSKEEIRGLMKQAGFAVEQLMEFNRSSVMGWLFNGRLLKRKRFPIVQLKIFNTLTPLFQLLDAHLPWPGLSIVAVGVKPCGSVQASPRPGQDAAVEENREAAPIEAGASAAFIDSRNLN